jgi:predicted metal-dependent HD superfamily phosphohydrolase
VEQDGAWQAREAGLRRRWSEPQRAYHTLDHLHEVLATIDALQEAGEPLDDPEAVRLAAWYHDAVYDPRSQHNEAASADLARAELPALGLAPARVERVAQLVLITRDHRPPPGDTDAAVLCDADLAVLARPPEDYRAYAASVRREYAFVPEDAWRRGRAAVLRGLLAKDPLYATATQRSRGEDRARRNLQAELDDLGQEPT